MPAYYHILNAPLNSTTLASDPDPSPEENPTGTPEQQATRILLRKFKARVETFGPALSLDERAGRWNNNYSKVIIETTVPHDPSQHTQELQDMLLLYNLTLAEITEYIHNNASEWQL